ncbi:MAG: D-alanine--D-alanine ligase, partial [Desulfovibrio sp.]|nr:D-alanine--D-alanine ligase [Desulfovibrio sp.]
HDFAFIGLHGAPGEDGLVQALLDAAACPYQGSGPAGSFLALNKAAAKQVFRQAGLPTADWEFLPLPPPAGWEPRLPYPLFVKSNTGGSSLRLGRAENRAELDAALAAIFAAGDEALLETELPGRELTCAVLGDEALPPLLIEPLAGNFFDYKSKYAKGGARELCPAPISAAATARAQELALAAHRALGLSGYSRTDFILDDADGLTLLEVNTLPGMTATSLVPQEAAAAGISFAQLLERLMELGRSRPRS